MEVQDNRDRYGILPAMAPLATPYVPFQQSSPERYTAKFGLVRGTLYPGLDLPFMGMVNTEEKSDTALHDLQALCFALQELALYLDTHGDDREATELFQEYSETYQKAMAMYQDNCRPLHRVDAVQDGTYQWTNSPWPWEFSANQEG